MVGSDPDQTPTFLAVVRLSAAGFRLDGFVSRRHRHTLAHALGELDVVDVPR
jgi:hypothetical protein